MKSTKSTIVENIDGNTFTNSICITHLRNSENKQRAVLVRNWDSAKSL